MTYQLPGSVVSAIDQAKGAAQAAVDAASPKLSDMINSVKSGAMFASKAPNLSTLSGMGVNISGITGALANAQANMTANLAAAQTAIMTKAKLAMEAGTTLSTADINASLGPLGVLKNLHSTVAAATAAAQNIASLGLDPTALAAAVGNLGSSITSTFDGMTAAAESAKAALEVDAKALSLVSMLTKPMIPQLASIVSANVDSSKLDKLSIMKTLAASPPPSVVPTKDKYTPSAPAVPSERAATTPAASTADRISKTEMKALDTRYFAAGAALSAVVGYSQNWTEAKKEDTQAAYNDWINARLDPSEIAPRNAYVAIMLSKPEPTQRTEEEQELVRKGIILMNDVKTRDWFKPYADCLANLKQKAVWYNLALAAWKADRSRFTLPTDLEQYLRSIT